MAGSPPLSLARDPDVAVARVLDPLAHPEPLGEGQSACDDKERQASPVTLSTEAGMCDAMLHHPSLLSEASQGLLAPLGCSSSSLSLSITRSCYTTRFGLVNVPCLWTPCPSRNGPEPRWGETGSTAFPGSGPRCGCRTSLFH